MSLEKQYGLVDAKTGKKLTVNDVFNNDSDSGGEHEGKSTRKLNEKEEINKNVKKQTKLEMQRALEQDPTVYQYDEIYDEMTQKKHAAEQVKVKPEKAPKYIENLMKTAERRKKENERRLERQIQKEREAEGDIFKDKEEFITSSYKQKLEEFKKAEEEEQKREYIESIMDVSKQKDLGGFYRHLYKETVPDENSGPAVKTEEKNQPCDDKDNKSASLKEDKTIKIHERNYRKRCNSTSADGIEKKVKSSSSSSDSDSSSDTNSSSSSEEEKIKVKNRDVAKQNLEGETVERFSKNNMDIETSKSGVKNLKVYKEESKSEEKPHKLKSNTKDFKRDDQSRRDRSNRSSVYERDRNNRNWSRRDDKVYKNDERDRRERYRDQTEKRSSDSRRKSNERERERETKKFRERSSERKIDNNKETTKGMKNENTKNETNIQERKRTMNLEKKELENENETVSENLQTAIQSIWEKRTVGAAFDAALQRYFQRRAERGL